MALQEVNPFVGMTPLFPELLEQPVALNPYDKVNCFDMLDVERELEGLVANEINLARTTGANVPFDLSELDRAVLCQSPKTALLAEALAQQQYWQDSWDRRPSDRVCESSLGDTVCLAACRAESITPVEIV